MDYYVNRGCAWWVWVTHAFSSFSVFVGIVSEMDTKLLVELYSHPFYCAAFIFSLFFSFYDAIWYESPFFYSCFLYTWSC